MGKIKRASCRVSAAAAAPTIYTVVNLIYAECLAGKLPFKRRNINASDATAAAAAVLLRPLRFLNSYLIQKATRVRCMYVYNSIKYKRCREKGR